MTDLPVILGAGAAVLLVAVVAVRVSTTLGLPSLLLYLVIGLVLGESGLGIRFDNAQLTESLGIAALVLILIEGGLTTRWDSVRPALPLGIALSTVSVVISIGIAGAALHLLLGLPWRVALLWGAVLSSTDAAAVFSVLRGLPVARRLVGALELESGLNDAPAFIAVVLLAGGARLSWSTPLLVGYELVTGAAIGVLLGVGGAWALRRASLPATGLYPLATVAVCVLAFAGADLAHASGLLAAYVCGLVLSNSRLPHRADTLSFAEGLGWLAQIGLFVLLGLYVSPPRLLAALGPALVAGLVMLLLARPVSVLAAALPLRIGWRGQAFLSWSGLRGAVPIVLALVPLTTATTAEEASAARRLVDVVFVLVVLLTVVQGGTLPVLARRLRLAETAEPTEVQVDVAALDTLSADLLQLTVPVGSKLHGVYVKELRLPVGALLSLVVRQGAGFIPDWDTRLRAGDQLLVVCTAAARGRAERRLRAVDRAGRLARWRGETGA
jgi:cell volume regulation protein A